eukprot:7425703-Pyramimonas_sp.AAC.1
MAATMPTPMACNPERSPLQVSRRRDSPGARRRRYPGSDPRSRRGSVSGVLLLIGALGSLFCRVIGVRIVLGPTRPMVARVLVARRIASALRTTDCAIAERSAHRDPGMPRSREC